MTEIQAPPVAESRGELSIDNQLFIKNIPNNVQNAHCRAKHFEDKELFDYQRIS